ncbi:cytochrome P450 4C1-like isoform X2 [Pararge aegeria]|nr:cytochrome P450 4C1-like isoform X2 [Pararge aegeria]
MFIYDLIKPYVGAELVAASVPVWKRNRRMLDMAFKPHILDGYLELFNQQAVRLTGIMANHVHNEMDFTNVITRNVLETISQTTMGMKIDGEDLITDSYTKAVDKVMGTITDRFRYPWNILDFIFNFSTLKKEQDEALKIIWSLSEQMVKQKKEEILNRQNNKIDYDNKEKKFQSCLEIILENTIKGESDNMLTDTQLRQIMDNLMLAGFDTTAPTILLILVCIGSYPNVQQKLYNEIVNELGKETRDIRKEDLTKLPYLEAVIKETLRLYPAGTVVARTTTTEVRLEHYTIPAGCHIMGHIWALNRNKEYWGPDADEFKPERWLDGSAPKHPAAFASFSPGRRNCIEFWHQFKNITSDCMKMGHVSYIYMGPYKFYVLSDPDDIYKLSNICLQKDRFSYEFTKELLGDGLLFSPVSTWKRHRKLINPTFNQQILDGFMSIFNSQGRRLVSQLAMEVGKGSFDHSPYVRQNFMETICLTALDDSINEEEALNYVRSFETYMNCNISRFHRPWLYPDILYSFSSIKKRHDECVKVLNRVCDSVLQKKRAQRKLNKSSANKDHNGPKLKVFMDLLMDLDEGQLTDREIRDEMNTIIMAGHDTSANVTVFALLLIGSYPEVQEKIFKELCEVFGGTDRDVEKQDLSRLVYLEAVLKETMRYYVMAPFVGRFLDQDVELKNYTIKAGHDCMLLLYGIHRNPLWGPDVDDFRPERWLDPATLPKNPNAFVGFSLGKRNCIGKAYAMMSMKAQLSHVLRRYRIRADHTKLVVKLDVLLKPVAGHFVSIEDRLKL